ncbi:MAG TPA: RIP metalloprotease RseP [Methyloradius sp.]
MITVHEYGHYQVARWCGVKVLKFSIGFGKPLFAKKLGDDQTEYVLAALPLGGYVKMLDEREAPVEASEMGRAFNRQPVWKRIAIVSAGPAANLILAVLLYWVIFMSGVTGVKPIIGDIPQDSPAAQASIKSGELITSVNNTAVASWQDVRWVLVQQKLKSNRVDIEASINGQSYIHELSLDSITDSDFESDFLTKLGLTTYQPDLQPKIGDIMVGSAAEKAGMKTGDLVLSVNGQGIAHWEDFVNVIRQHPGQRLDVKLVRDNKTIDLFVTPDAISDSGKQIGRVGAAYQVDPAILDQFLIDVKYAPLIALSKAADKTWETSIFSLKMLGSMLTGDVSWRGLSGPVTIASYAGQSAHMGLKAFIGFLALVSISLGVLNLLPVPVLDGGHLLYYMIEIFKGSPVSDKTMEMGQRVGFALLGLLMACAFYNDINRLITG